MEGVKLGSVGSYRASQVDVGTTLAVLQAVALCCLGAAAVLRLIDSTRTGSGLAIAITWFVLVPLIAVLWAVRPRLVRAGHGTEATALAVVLATPVAVFGTLGFTIPVLLLIVAFAVVDVSLRAGVHATILISSIGFALLVSDSCESWEAFGRAAVQALINVVPVVVLLCFGVTLGLALRGFEERRHSDKRVIDRLRHASEIEKELLLSDERARSARELHDGLGYRLTLVLMSLELAERMRVTDVDQAWAEVRTAKNTTSDALTEMRTWVRALSPVRDAGARGLAALELIAESFRGTGLAVEVLGDDTSDGILSTDDSMSLLVYRAVQEGLTNALRHGGARKVKVVLLTQDCQLNLAITNSLGRSVVADLGEGQPALGFGLRGLADRTAERGGTMRAARVGDEFRLDIMVPLGRTTGERERGVL